MCGIVGYLGNKKATEVLVEDFQNLNIEDMTLLVLLLIQEMNFQLENSKVDLLFYLMI